MKRIISFILAAVMSLACLTALASCGDNGDNTGGNTEKNTYTVTVIDDNGNPVADANVKFVNADTGKLAKMIKTGADGKAVFESEEKLNLKAQLFQAEGYTFDRDATYDFGEDGNAQISIVKDAVAETATFTVYVIDEAGAPVEGIAVHICKKNSTCMGAVYTDAEGKSEFEVDPNFEWLAKFVADGDDGYVPFGDGRKVTLTYIAE